MKVVINRCFGGFGISDVACKWLIKEKGWTVTGYDDEGELVNPDAQMCDRGEDDDGVMGKYYPIDKHDDGLRANPDLIECIESIGAIEAASRFADLQIVEIPDDVEWEIAEYDGLEHIAEKHRTWG